MALYDQYGIPITEDVPECMCPDSYLEVFIPIKSCPRHGHLEGAAET